MKSVNTNPNNTSQKNLCDCIICCHNSGYEKIVQGKASALQMVKPKERFLFWAFGQPGSRF